MSKSAFHHIAVAAVLAGLAVPAAAGEPAGEGAPAGLELADHVLVLARNVHPRIAYRGPRPEENPVRVEVVVFPGAAFSDSVGGLGLEVLGDRDLASTSPMAPIHRLAGPDSPLMQLGGPLSGGPGATGAGGGAPVGASASSVGGAVMKATSGLGESISRMVMGATSTGGGR